MTGFKSIIDLFTPYHDAGERLSGSNSSASSIANNETNTLVASSNNKALSASAHSFDHHKQAQASASFLGRWIKRKKEARSDLDERQWRRNADMAQAIERTLRGGARSGPLSGGNTLDMRCTTLDETGAVTTTARQFSKLELCTMYGIQPRDLRKLDSAVPTVVPTILVRRACILCTILHLRVVITGKQVALFDSVGSEDTWLKGVFVWHLEGALKSTGRSAHGLPYEFRALESCLISVTTALETELANVKSLVLNLLADLEDHIERDKLRLLLQYSRKLSAFQKRATLVQECLEEVLENDEDLAAMYLTAKLENKPRSADDHEEVELLLENFSKRCEEIVSEVETLSANVRSTEDIIELILDSNRNSLLGYDLRVSIATLGLTSGALIAGLFGMNLPTSLEDHPFAFPVVATMSFALAGFVTLFGLRRLRQMRRVGLGWRDPQNGTGGLIDKWSVWLVWAACDTLSKSRRFLNDTTATNSTTAVKGSNKRQRNERNDMPNTRDEVETDDFEAEDDEGRSSVERNEDAMADVTEQLKQIVQCSQNLQSQLTAERACSTLSHAQDVSLSSSREDATKVISQGRIGVDINQPDVLSLSMIKTIAECVNHIDNRSDRTGGEQHHELTRASDLPHPARTMHPLTRSVSMPEEMSVSSSRSIRSPLNAPSNQNESTGTTNLRYLVADKRPLVSAPSVLEFIERPRKTFAAPARSLTTLNDVLTSQPWQRQAFTVGSAERSTRNEPDAKDPREYEPYDPRQPYLKQFDSIGELENQNLAALAVGQSRDKHANQSSSKPVAYTSRDRIQYQQRLRRHHLNQVFRQQLQRQPSSQSQRSVSQPSGVTSDKPAAARVSIPSSYTISSVSSHNENDAQADVLTLQVKQLRQEVTRLKMLLDEANIAY
ncbi:magnesium ion transporter [Microbotryomycetes sp. JL221]|nr:magnesium ion transporter [Microbotryomycetes sp. JL221]